MNTIPVLKVSQILDKFTVVLTGTGVEKLVADEPLVVVARGAVVPDVGVPLIVPKATVIVSDVAGVYAVAKAPMMEVEEGGFAGLVNPRKIQRRTQLAVDEKALSGNPAISPIAVGDVVIRRKDLAEFVRLQGDV